MTPTSILSRAVRWSAGFGDRFERALARLYERLGSRYLYVPAWLACGVVIPGLILLLLPIIDLYAPISSSALPAVVALIAAALYTSALITWHRFERPASAVVSQWWDAGRPASGAPKVWEVVTNSPRDAATTLATIGLALCMAAGAAIGATLDRQFGELLAGESVVFVTALWTAVVWLFVHDLIMRPVQLDAASRLPAGFVPPSRGLSFRVRVLGAILTASMLAAFVAIVILDRGESTIGELIGPGLIAGCVALAFTLALTAPALRSMLRPIDDLIGATRRIAGGDLATRAPVISDDELGRLASSFNEMASELQRSREEIVNAREEERRRLRRDLHDGLGPTLAGLAMRLESTQALVADDPAAAEALLGKLRGDTVELIADVRRLVHGLRPPQLDDLGLIGAIRERAARLVPANTNGGLRITVDAPAQLPPLPAALEVAAYRIAEEALTNVVRHSGAHTCTVRVVIADGFALEIRDDGGGLRGDRVAGVGLSSMSERAAELGGSCSVQGVPGGGTTVVARLPLPPPAT